MKIIQFVPLVGGCLPSEENTESGLKLNELVPGGNSLR